MGQIKGWINQSIKNKMQKRENNYKLFNEDLFPSRITSLFGILSTAKLEFTKKNTKKYSSTKIKTNLEKLGKL